MIIYDLEIVKCIPPKDGKLDNRFLYCEGWHDHANMGISVICAYDYREKRYRVFMKDNFEEFINLVKNRNLMIGYNNIRFDNRVIKAVCDFDIPPVHSFDLLQQIWIAVGLDPDKFSPRHHGQYGLKSVIEANFPNAIGKTGHGALAPEQWQQGKYGEVVDYCLSDVRITKMLMDKLLSSGMIISPNNSDGTNGFIKIDVPPIAKLSYSVMTNGVNIEYAPIDDIDKHNERG